MDDINSKKLDEAYNLHVSGKFEEAKKIYEVLLQSFPDDLNVLNLYAQLNVSLKNFDIALEIFNKVYESTHLDDILLNISKVYFYKNDYTNAILTIEKVKNESVESLRLLALAYIKSNNTNQAISTYLKLIKNSNALYSDYLNLSMEYNKINDFDNAVKYGIKACEMNPDDYTSNLHVASLYDYSGDNENALKYLLTVSKLKPDNKILYRIGTLYKKLNKDDEALKYFNSILEVEPDNKKCLLSIASIFQNHDKNVSVEIYNKLLQKEPDDVPIIEQLYIIHINMMNDIDAYNVAQRLIELKPDEIEYYTFSADALMGLNRYDEALGYYLKVLNKNPEHKYAEIQVSYIYSITGRDEEAIKILSKYLDNKFALLDYTLLMCKNQQLDKVCKLMYDHVTKIKTKEQMIEEADRNMYRLKLDKKVGSAVVINKTLRESGEPEFNKTRRKYKENDFFGKDITGKRVLLYTSGGIGDTIMFSRYIPEIINKAAKTIIQVPGSLYELYKYNYPNIEIIEGDAPVDASRYDYTGSIYGLFCYLGVDLKNIKYSDGYFKIKDELVKEKSSLFNTGKKKVGLFWQGNPLVMAQRSVKLQELLPLFDLSEIQYYSFQVGKMDFDSAELKSKLTLIDLADYIHNYTDTAALLKNIDLLISIDTSISNLAGALGVNTYLMLPFDAEWRWFHCTDTTPWYDSIKIFKQKIPNDWNGVVQRIKNELQL